MFCMTQPKPNCLSLFLKGPAFARDDGGGSGGVGDFSPEALVSIWAQLLNLIDPSASLGDELPGSVPERFRICTDIAQSVKNLGYISDMSYHKNKVSEVFAVDVHPGEKIGKRILLDHAT